MAPSSFSSSVETAETMKRPHALVIPFPAQGHIGPLMQLSLKLASHGYLITFLTTQFNLPLLQPLIPLLRGRHRLPVRLSQIVDDKRGSGDTTGASSIVELCTSFFTLGPALQSLVQSLLLLTSSSSSSSSSSDDIHHDHDTFHELFHASPLTCIISDLYLHFTQDVAHKFGLPHLAFWTAGSNMLSTTMAITAHRQTLPPGPDDEITWIPGVPRMKRREINPFLFNSDPDDVMYSVYAESYRRLSETSVIAINTFEELEPGALAALRKDNAKELLAIGPLLPEAFLSGGGGGGREEFPTAALWPEDHEGSMTWLDAQEERSVLYVSFGSIAIMSGEQLTELAEGLAGSGAAVLWVMRPDLLSEAAGGEAILKRFRERMGERAYVTEWAPQLRVLAHSAVAGFLSHCGWNSTLESLVAGVPVLGWPYFADQMVNKRCLVDVWGCGVEFRADETGVVRRGEISGVVQRVLRVDEPDGQALRTAAQKWRRASLEAVAGASGEAFSRLLLALQTPNTQKIENN